jgi:hypothetical protein
MAVLDVNHKTFSSFFTKNLIIAITLTGKSHIVHSIVLLKLLKCPAMESLLKGKDEYNRPP